MKAGVVIPVFADPIGLAQTLSSVAAAGAPLVVVVVDGPHAATEQVAREAGATLVVQATSQGSYAARNAGLAALPPDVDAVLFTDAGCAVAPGWVEAHLAALGRASLSGGAVDVTLSRRPSPAEWVDRCRNLRQQSYVLDAGFAATCNLAVFRLVAESVRFDEALRSGGDRDFCLRAAAAGHQLVYTPDALVRHPARRTGREVLSKARRVGEGVAALPPASRPTPARPRRPSRALTRQGRAQGLRVGPVWAARVSWLDWRRANVLRMAALRPAPVEGLHVVVLLGSRWQALSTTNTRWRKVVELWVDDPRVARVTLVDHPWFRPTAREPLVRQAPSWLAETELLEIVVPTTLQPGPLDRLAWRRAARSLRAALPAAQQRLVVATSPVTARLLPHLRDGSTTTAFDLVDMWRNTQLAGPLGARLRDGYTGAGAADVGTAVSSTLAEVLKQWCRRPTFAVQNGVDLAAYADARAAAPEGLPDQPFAVYVGNLSSRLDLDLVAQTAAQLADEVPVVLAGPADARTGERLRELPVCWLGPVDAALIPGLLRRAAVALYPHLDTQFTEAVDSMKIMEYLAAGLPIVSTPVPGLPAGVITAVDASAFAVAVLEAARGLGRREPHPFVRDRDWSKVADSLLTAYLTANGAST